MRSAMCAPETGSSIPQTKLTRHVGVLERRGPALVVALAVGDVADQQVPDALAVVAIDRAPDLGAVGRGVEALGERRREARDEQLLVDQLADPRPLLGVEQRRLGAAAGGAGRDTGRR